MSEQTQDMQIYAIIAQMQEILESSQKPKIGGGNKRIVDFDEFMDLIGDLKVTIPEDIRRANKVIVDSQKMLDDANEEASYIMEEAKRGAESTVAQADAYAENTAAKAREEYERLISEDEIYMEAQKRAKLLALKAEANANMVYENAKVYADQVLQSLENILVEYKQLVAVNRRDLDIKTDKLNPVAAEPQVQQSAAPQPQAQPRVKPVKKPKPMPKPVAEPQPAEEEPLDEDFDGDFAEERKGGGLFGWLKRGKKNDEDDFYDDDTQE